MTSVRSPAGAVVECSVAGQRASSSSGARARKRAWSTRGPRTRPGLSRALDEIETVLGTPLAVAFVADGRRATQAAKLTPSDAVALGRRLGMREPKAADVRSMEDLPEVAHLVHWARAADLLAARGTKIVSAPRAGDLSRDPLDAWFAAAITITTAMTLPSAPTSTGSSHSSPTSAPRNDTARTYVSLNWAAPWRPRRSRSARTCSNRSTSSSTGGSSV